MGFDYLAKGHNYLYADAIPLVPVGSGLAQTRILCQSFNSIHLLSQIDFHFIPETLTWLK